MKNFRNLLKYLDTNLLLHMMKTIYDIGVLLRKTFGFGTWLGSLNSASQVTTRNYRIWQDFQCFEAWPSVERAVIKFLWHFLTADSIFSSLLISRNPSSWKNLMLFWVSFCRHDTCDALKWIVNIDFHNAYELSNMYFIFIRNFF